MAQQLRRLDKVLAMKEGEGQDSYSKNSKIQNFMVTKLLFPELQDALDQVTLPTYGPVLVADLGCSSGPNTIGHLGLIVKKLRTTSLDAASREYQAFFSDLPSNDFNNLFHLLTSDISSSPGGRESFFVAGVPGSFYDRLFARSTIHVFFSSSSIPWLSKVPEEILDRNSPAFNEDKIWTYRSSRETVAAYKRQAATDLTSFLNARAAELAPGGLCFFTTPTPENPELSLSIGDADDWGFAEIFDETWNGLIKQGVLTQEQKDTFNVPIYFRSPQDVKEVVEKLDSSFYVHSIKVNETILDLNELFPDAETKEEQALRFSKTLKAVIPSLLESHIGKEKATVFLQNLDEVVAKMLVPAVLDADHDPNKAFKMRLLAVSLIRK